MNDTQNLVENLAGAIIRVISFFDLFDFPLVAIEILEGLDCKSNLGEVMVALDEMAKKTGKIATKDGFYFLSGRSEIVETRLQRYNTSSRKFRRAFLIVRIFKLIPWIKLVAIGNVIGADNFREEADIDFFIVTSKGRIWITRLFCVLIVKLLGLRASEMSKQDMICLSFFVSEDCLDLSNLMIGRGSEKAALANQPVEKDDPYFVYWLANLNIIYIKERQAVGEFWQANDWLKAVLPNWSPIIRLSSSTVFGSLGKVYGKVLNFFLGRFEKSAKNLQFNRLAPKLRELVNLDTRVVMNDGVLKLHDNDRRGEFRGRWGTFLDSKS